MATWPWPDPPAREHPEPNEAFAYANADFGGACEAFGVGEDKNLANNPIGEDTISSVKVGANVVLSLYPGRNFTGGGGTFEFFTGNDNSFADNAALRHHASSCSRSAS